MGCVKRFIPKVTKKQTLLQEGEVCIYNAFLKKNFALILWMKKETNIRFAIEGGGLQICLVFLPMNTIYTIEALRFRLLLLTTEAREALMDQFPCLSGTNACFYKTLTLQPSQNSALTETAEESISN
jgi:hypothetical protein